MKNKILSHRLISFFFLLSIVIISCEPPVIFTEPQPENFPRQKHFDLMYRGKYFCESDNSVVIVGPKLLYKEKIVPFVISQSDLDTAQNIRIENDQLIIDRLDENPTSFEQIGDSIYAQLMLRDTFFEIGPNEVLTKFRGHHILNRKIENGNWEIAILTLNDDLDIEVSIAAVPSDLQRLQEITPVQDISRGDTIQYLISPTVQAFDQILNEELIFNTCDYYRRLKIRKEI